MIAECKQASPSAGLLRADFDPAALAARYQAAGAAAISVVTEPDFFGGDPAWLAAVRAAVELPVLRKDFVVDERQLRETAALGADAVLLIQRILPPPTPRRARWRRPRTRWRCCSRSSPTRIPAPAVASGAAIIGVNARDLATFDMRLERVESLAGVSRPTGCGSPRAASGPEDVVRLAAAGYDAFLVGEHLVRADDPEKALRRLRGQDGHD